MKIVDIQGPETLAQLVEQVESGEEMILARAGKPVAKVVAIQPPARRALGQWRGRVRMSEDFDAPLPESELADWLGERS